MVLATPIRLGEPNTQGAHHKYKVCFILNLNPPRSGYASTLPSPRAVSAGLEQLPASADQESKTNSHMLMQWGQFIDHDMLDTAKEAFDCCDPKIRFTKTSWRISDH